MQIVKIKYPDKFSLIKVNHPTELSDYADLDFVGYTQVSNKKIREYKHKSCKD